LAGLDKVNEHRRPLLAGRLKNTVFRLQNVLYDRAYAADG
jgi:hypothetical protein